MLRFILKLFSRDEINIGIVSFGYKGKHWHW